MSISNPKKRPNPFDGGEDGGGAQEEHEHEEPQPRSNHHSVREPILEMALPSHDLAVVGWFDIDIVDIDGNQNLVVANEDSINFYRLEKSIGSLCNHHDRILFERTFPAVSPPVDMVRYDSSTENLVLISKFHKSVEIYDSEGGSIHTFSTGKQSRASDLAINTCNGNIFICDFLLSQIQEFGSDGTFKQVISTPYHPYGIGIDCDLGHLLIADTLNKRVEVYSLADNVVLFRFGSEVLRCPESIVTDKNHNIYVGDAVARCVQIFDKIGQHLGSIPNCTPASLVIDNINNYIFVSDHDRRQILGFELID